MIPHLSNGISQPVEYNPAEVFRGMRVDTRFSLGDGRSGNFMLDTTGATWALTMGNGTPASGKIGGILSLPGLEVRTWSPDAPANLMEATGAKDLRELLRYAAIEPGRLAAALEHLDRVRAMQRGEGPFLIDEYRAPPPPFRAEATLEEIDILSYQNLTPASGALAHITFAGLKGGSILVTAMGEAFGRDVNVDSEPSWGALRHPDFATASLAIGQQRREAA